MPSKHEQEREKYIQERERQRQLKYFRRGLKRFGILLGGTVALLAVSWVLSRFIEGAEAGVPASQPVSQPAGSVSQAELPEDESTLGAAGGWNFIGPLPQAPEEMTLTSPDYRLISLPENGRVDMSYFESVTFVGDSITQGFEVYPSIRIPGATYCAYKNAGPKQIFDGSIQRKHDNNEEIPMEALVASNPKNVYILLGSNALVGMKPDDVLQYYREMLRQMKEKLPQGTHYYIQSVTPIRPEVTRLSMAALQEFNHKLALMAWEEGAYFLDLNEVLAGEDFYLKEEYATSDGIHIQPAAYSVWTEYLITHTAYSPDNPYLEGSNDRSPPPAE